MCLLCVNGSKIPYLLMLRFRGKRNINVNKLVKHFISVEIINLLDIMHRPSLIKNTTIRILDSLFYQVKLNLLNQTD
jgi:hypothetical protein